MTEPRPVLAAPIGVEDPASPRATARTPESANYLALIILGLGLYVPGLSWGLPALVSWSQDSIAAFRTLGAVAEWPDHWRGRYPPLHYLILRAAYEPLLIHWNAQGAADFDPDARRYRLAEPQAPKIAAMILAARGISVLMGIGAGLAIYVAARRLLRDPRTALLAAAAFMIGADFTCFAHLDNVDVPSIFWFALSLVFFARLRDTHRLRDAALFGLFGALAISTKDAVAGVYPGLALGLIVERAARIPAQSAARRWRSAILQLHWLIGVIFFALPYLLLNGVFHNPDAYVTRMRYWLSPPPDALHAQQATYETQWELLAAVFRYAASAVGWPMLAALIAGFTFALIHRPRLALLAALPAATCYAIVLAPQGFVYARFLFAPLLLFYFPLADAAAAWLRRGDIPMTARLAVPILIALPSLGYAWAVGAEMRADSRYAAEEWFAQNVPPPSGVGAFALGREPDLRAQYLPRVHEMGYATYPVVMLREWFERPQPQYLILDGFTAEDFRPEQRACLRDLLDGKLGYRMAAFFEGRYLPPRRSWAALAGWGTPPIGKISPRLLILERDAE